MYGGSHAGGRHGNKCFQFGYEHVFRCVTDPVFSICFWLMRSTTCHHTTQAALLEAMEERQVTIDGVRNLLPDNFTVVATQNPIEFEGTYPLPEAQLDRFLVKISLGYPAAEEETNLLVRTEHGF